ncbi:MAG: WG repeat-containing protein [Sphingobacteriales bacterium]|nr:MAG: WG repeat-containing protein [Sphingobacteriales bacterium]
MKLDEFGKEKWGFIDKTGKVIIELQYSRSPGDFYHGKAIIFPASSDNIQLAFIDKKGAIILTIDKTYQRVRTNLAPENSYGYLGHGGFSRPAAFSYGEDAKHGKFVNGFSSIFSDPYILIDEHTLQVTKLKLGKGEFYNRHTNVIYNLETQGQFAFSPPFKNNLAKLSMRGGLDGIIDKNGNIVLPPVFDLIEIPDDLNDPTKATYTIWESGKAKNTIGFINAKGQFTIIKGDPTTW